MTDKVEQRRFPRIDFEVTINCDENFKAKSKNISLGGICLVSNTTFVEGKFIKMTFTLLDGQIFHAIGKTAWTKKAEGDQFAYGIQFWDLDDEKIKTLRRFIKGVSATQQAKPASQTAAS